MALTARVASSVHSKKPLSRSISVKKGSSSKTRSQTPADRKAVTRESKSRANSVELQSPKMK